MRVENSTYSEDDEDYEASSNGGSTTEGDGQTESEDSFTEELLGGSSSVNPVGFQGAEGSPDSTDYGSSPIALSDIELMMELFDNEVPASPSGTPRDYPILSSEGDFNPSDESFHASQQARSSTKMRAATLAYLRGFARDPERLREEMYRLRKERDLYVLHLCGCGLPYTNESGTLVPGCCEWSHLRLGTSVENALHRSYHIVMEKSNVEDFPQLCDIIHRAEYGFDLF
jgi:hypothetical protein